ncbi:hypothetical protein ACFXJO_03550 [Streptomyces lavendulae]|uniref:hypothetical protein n=1 Tax=Streptomyces lavendulae TaxID=1914 RepID=UPI0036D06958
MYANPAATNRFTVNAFLNNDQFACVDGYRLEDTVTEVTTPTNQPLPFVFNATDDHAAADALRTLSHSEPGDEPGQKWPAEIRSLNIGDVVQVTAPDGTVTHLAVDTVGYIEIETVGAAARPAVHPHTHA